MIYKLLENSNERKEVKMVEGIDKLAFRSKQVIRLFNISLRQLNYWVKTGLVAPSILNAEGRGSTRVFSYRDLIQIRTVKALIDGGMSIQMIRKSATYIKENLGINLPLTARLLTDGKSIFKVVNSDDELILAVDTLRHQGQGVFFVPIGKLVHEVEKKVEEMRKAA